jgi:hypothetical protein
MRQPAWIGGYRIFFGLLTLTAIGYQFALRASQGSFDPVNFFSFFTIQSNLFAAAVLLVAGMRRNRGEHGSVTWDLARGAAVVYLATTGVVYGLLLTGYTDALQTATPWVNTVLHRIVPLVIVVDWMLCPPSRHIPFRQALVWIIYPIVYLAYTLARGPVVGWYPYPFLDPRGAGGYLAVAAYCAAITAGFLVFSSITVVIGRRVRLRLEPSV